MITCRLHGWAVAAATVTALSLAAPAARAAGDDDKAAAKVYFTEARKLMTAGKYEVACPKLEQARKLYAGSGILLNLGDCYEHMGKIASAWAAFRDAVGAAATAKRSDDESEARKRMTALEPRLPKLEIRVSSPAPGETISRDGAPLPASAWNVATPADPGTHVLTAEAPGRASWSMLTSALIEAKTVTIEVPELTPSSGAAPIAVTPVPAPITSSPASSATSGSGGDGAGGTPDKADKPVFWTNRRILAATAGGSGVVLLAVGGVLGLSAKAEYDKAQGETGSLRRDDSNAAVTTGTIATIFAVGGVLLAGTGAVLWFTAPSSNPSTAGTTIGTTGNQLVLRGTF